MGDGCVRATGDLRHRREGDRRARRRLAGCCDRRHQRRNRTNSGSRHRAWRQLLRLAAGPGSLPDRGQDGGLQEPRPSRHRAAGRPDHDPRPDARGRRAHRERDGDRRVADHRLVDDRGRGPHLLGRAPGASRRQSELHGVRRQRAGNRLRPQRRVPQRQLPGQRAAHGRQCHHLRRLEQHRRAARFERRRPDPRGQRIDPGSPGDDQRVRRGIRPGVGRGDQRRHQVGHEPVQRGRCLVFSLARP